MDLGQDALHLLETGPALGVEVHAAAPSLEELGVQMLLQGADAVGDGGGVTPSSSAARTKLRCRAAASNKRRQSRGGRDITDSGAGNVGVGGR